MEIYICKDCGRVTDEPNIERDYDDHGGIRHYETFLGCCDCGGEYAEAKECPVCGEYYDGEYDVCDECLKKRMTVEGAKKYSDDRNFSDVEVKIPNYLYYILGEEIIVDVLYNELHSNPEHYAQKVWQYLNEDIMDFVEWVEEGAK